MLIAAFLIAITLCGCNRSKGLNGNSLPQTLSSTQISSLAAQVNSALIANSDLTSSEQCYNPYLTVFQEEYCSIGVNTSAACPGGGVATMAGSVSGDFSGVTVTGTGTGTLDLTLKDCSIPSSTETMATAAPLTVTGSWFYFYTGMENVTSTTTGIINYSSSPTGSCPVNLSLSATVEGDSEHTLKECTYSGTACGQTIATGTSCMPAQ